MGIIRVNAAVVTINTTISPENSGTVKVNTQTSTGQEWCYIKWPESWTNLNYGEAKAHKGTLATYTVGIKYKLEANPNEGYYFSNYKNVPEARCSNKGDYDSETIHESIEENPCEYITKYVTTDFGYTITAIFKEQTVYKDYARVVARLVDADGRLLSYGAIGDYSVKVGDLTAGKECVYNSSKSIKTFDNDQGGSWSYTYIAACSDGYEFVGWFEADENGDVPNTDGVLVGTPENTTSTYKKSYTTNTLYSKRANAPEAKTMYAVFRPKLNLFSYIAVDDQFEETPMTPNAVMGTDNISLFKYMDNVQDGVTERYYKIETDLEGDITVGSYSGDFEGKIETIQGLKVLHVTPTSIEDELEGVIIVKVGDKNRVELTIKATKEQIFVTLNPAEDLAGSYYYTQSTTGQQEFSVTTSQVVKQMMFSSDYSFTFRPESLDDNKYQFEKWVIRKADGTEIEDVTSNLLYRFEGGETITPVFTAVDRAIFIVKSEPLVDYLDLQAALDRAAALKGTTGTDQVVVVKSKAGRLVTGDYTVPNGVTLLVPGESTYMVMKGDLNENHYADGGTQSAYCTLNVEDNTNITVAQGGCISVYAKLRITTAGSNIIAYNYGHILLGENCSITVNSGGGLYAFGFITGDKSSHITMKSGSEVYEPFTMTDWRGGSETIGNWVNVPIIGGTDGKEARVFPIGQYYIQSVEVPMTIEAGAIEKLSCCVEASSAKAAVNMAFICNYSDAEGLFGLGSGTSITKSYDPATDRLKFEFNGNGVSSSKVKIGCMNLKIKVPIVGTVDVNSKDYVMPIQNNMDIDVKNTTIDVKYDVAYMPGSTMRVHDDAVINVENSMYIYDRSARGLGDGVGYWGSKNNLVLPLQSKSRPGGIQYPRKDADLVDARLIINGDMNINGALYTVQGGIGDDLEDGQGGANITSEGSGKINVNKLGTATVVKQWKQDVGAQSLELTSPNLLLHNDKSKEATSAYTSVTQTGVSYTYYQHDGTWRLPQPGITGIKLYDSSNNEIEKFLVTNPNVGTVSGYLLATLEPISGVTYDVSDFGISFSSGGAITQAGDATIVNGKLRIPVQYAIQNNHGDNTTILTIANKENVGFECNISVPLLGTEDYTPIFEVPSTLDIYGRIGESTSATLPIKYDAGNVVEVTNPAVSPTNPVWTARITGTDAKYFAFSLGSEGNGLADAKVTFIKPEDKTEKKAKLKLKATYTDGDLTAITSVEHEVALSGKGLEIANTMEFNNVGTITSNTSAFELLKYINSPGAITVKTTPETTPEDPSAVLKITKVDGRYMVTPMRMGQVEVTVSQEASGAYPEKNITTTIAVVGNPQSLATVHCVEDKEDFEALTANVDNVTYEDSKIKFTATNGVSIWSLHFNSMPGTLTFTPHGKGYWAIQESFDGVDWTELIWWTQLPEEAQTVALSPRSRKLQISYMPTSESDLGYITGVCVNPFTLHADITKLYVPVVNGEVQEVSVVFTHSEPTIDVNFTGNAVSQLSSDGITDPTFNKSTSENFGGVFNTFYKTTVTLSGGVNIPELNDGFNLVATQGENSAAVTLATYDFPKPLPIESENWMSDDTKLNINGYDESEYYYHYMVASNTKNVKWDAERKNVVFLNVGSKIGEVRQVVFGYEGLPNVVRFNSLSKEWKIAESEDGTKWAEHTPTITTDGEGVNTIEQLISSDSKKYVRIKYVGTEINEVLINNLVIEGFPSATALAEVIISKNDNSADEFTASNTFTIHVKNLPSMKLELDNTTDFKMYYVVDDTWTEMTNETELTSSQYAFLALNKEGEITIGVKWKGANMVGDGYIRVLNGENDKELAKVHLVGEKATITKDDATSTGINTGIPTTYTYNNQPYEGYIYGPIDLTNAFETAENGNGNALFDYLIIYGETTTIDGTKDIIVPTASKGSNAQTPYYIYKRNAEGIGYEFVKLVENANTAHKVQIDGFTTIQEGESPTIYVNVEGSLSVYMTGFCPFATTGSDKSQEGVWLFRGTNGETLNIYLDDCYIYSRNKSVTGGTMRKDDEDASFFDEGYARGSGGVLVFENTQISDEPTTATPFSVNVHTIGDNVFKSNYGSFFQFMTMRAYQISAPLHIHMNSESHVKSSKTELTLDDVWPTGLGENDFKRTNGFLSLRKQSNNAPSIDLGNEYSVVNFRGGRVELENAQIVSPNYKTTLAISHRSGEFGGNTGFRLAYGIGTDAVGGRVNFYDGTTTVLPMEVAKEYRQYYLMDTEPAIGEDGEPVLKESTMTSCLRCPTNTYVYGGSQCFMRACSHVTSKGGAPKGLDKGGNEVYLGQYVYTMNGTDATDDNSGLVTSIGFPAEDMSSCVKTEYGLASISPDANKKLYFWVPEGCGGVTAEKDKLISVWKACMTEIGAEFAGKGGSIGGNITIEENEEVQYLLYCQIDDNIYNVISEPKEIDGNGDIVSYKYSAPVKVPDIAQEEFGTYTEISPSHVGSDKANEISSRDGANYTINNKVYYITTATADVWMTFTAPFNVEKIWVVETYSEEKLEETKIKTEIVDGVEKRLTKRQSVLLDQARHNADFAAFFGVAMALGSEQTFDAIFQDWKAWALYQDKALGVYKGTDASYALRDKYKLTPYTEGNWATANFYLNHDDGEWDYADGVYEPKWKIDWDKNGNGKVDESDGPLLEKGETYSLLFPYCVGCWEENEETEEILEREYWDYWSGKFLIFEGKSGEQIISGSNFLEDGAIGVFEGEENYIDANTEYLKADVRGNSTFAFLTTTKEHVLPYSASLGGDEGFVLEESSEKKILPTESFLLVSDDILNQENGQQLFSISRMGKIKYRPTSEDNDDDVTTGGDHVPTINGGSDIFVTSVAEGINIAVSEPQAVGVFSATGQLIYSGWVETSVDVNLATNGVYVIVGENETVKAIFRQTP